MSQRAAHVFAEDAASMEDLTSALAYLRSAPWKPNPPGTRYGAPQERYTEAEVDAYVIEILRRSAAKIVVCGEVIVP